MDNHDDTLFWRLLCWAFIAFVGCISGCVVAVNHKDDSAMVQMVERGADPLAARCAVKNEDRSVTCAILAAKRQAP